MEKSNYCFWNPTRMTNALRAQLFFKRLNAYAVFSVLACAVILMPLYLGEGYVRVLERAAAAAVPSLQFWLPRFRLSLFSWPSDLPFPSQVALAVSLEFLSLELLLVKWGVLMQWLRPIERPEMKWASPAAMRTRWSR